ncbi:energy transducer TonB [Belliella sp. DSM 107340]|uniref:Energy transducer TonB n=1 Tax=Belliella calami TaxID=2923436 RepID=A0ABS9UN03_9BACT|nr:energy transducer TonB [Belliella calami]MCH7397999.1 energy transducer TonB [Belliella calami]
MRKIFTKIQLILFILILGLRFASYGQERKIIPLNEHFFAIETGGGEHVFNNVISSAIEKELNEKIFTLDNRLVKVIKHTFGGEEKEVLLWTQEQILDANGKLQFTKLSFTNADTAVTKIIVDDNLILDLACLYNNCSGLFLNSDGDEEIIDRNIFEPSFKSKMIWQEFLNSNLTYPLAARRVGAQGEVMVGMQISDSGEVIESKILNSKIISPVLVKEVERIIKKYDKGFVPARDLNGKNMTAWMYFPVKFVLN